MGIDFSRALFTEPVITVHSKAMWGGVTIIVPPNVVVEQNGRAIMGGFGGTGGLYSNSTCQKGTASAAGIVVRLYGTSVMGGITAIVNKKAAPAQVISRSEAARLLREPPPVGATSQLDVVGDLLGGVFGGLVDKANEARDTGAIGKFLNAEKPAAAPPASVSNPCHVNATYERPCPTLLQDPAKRAAPVAETCQDWKLELKELKVMLDEGILTQDEFDCQKQRVLQGAR